MEGWHRSHEHPRMQGSPQRTPSPSPARSGASTPPLLFTPRSPVDDLPELDSLDDRIRLLEINQFSPRKSTRKLPYAKLPPPEPSSFSEPLSLLAQSLITLENSRTSTLVSAQDSARHALRFAVEGVLDLAIGMSGTSICAQDVLKALMEESDLARPTQPLGDEEEVPATPSATPKTTSTDDRLTALEQSTSASQAAVLDRLAKMEKQMKKQARRSAKEGSLLDGERKEEGSRCDCTQQKQESEKEAREQRERMEAEAKGLEDDLLSEILPMVKQHRADLKLATAVASERFRKQALAQVQASLRASRARNEEGIHSSESSRFLSWYCETAGFTKPTIEPPTPANGKTYFEISVEGARLGFGKSPEAARCDAALFLRTNDTNLDDDWRAYVESTLDDKDLAMVEEIGSALQREKSAYESRLASLGWRLEEDARGVLYRSRS